MRSNKTYPLALLCILVFSTNGLVRCASADEAQVATTPASIRCAEDHPISLTLPDAFERVPSNNPAVLCVFRNKNGGFPTLNIVVEPRHEGAKPPTLEQYVEGVTRGYTTVGLSDAKLSNSEVGEIQGVPFFSADVRFTNDGASMAARILVLQVHDRTYTASAIGRADAADFAPTSLSSLTESLTIDGLSSSSTRTGDKNYTALILGFLVVMLVAYGALLLRKRKSGNAR